MVSVPHSPEFVLQSEFGSAAGLCPLTPGMTHTSDEETDDSIARVGMHAALLRWPGSRRLLCVFRLSDVAVDDGTDGNSLPHRRRLTSSLHYAELDGSASTLLSTAPGLAGQARLLPLLTWPTRQLLAGPEDGRLFTLGGRPAVLYNDVLPDRSLTPVADTMPAPAAKWRIRRGLYLSALMHEEAWGGGESLQLRPSAPILLQPSLAAQRAAGAASDVEKNWVPFQHNGTLMLAYSIDPHLILRVSPAALAAAERNAEAAAQRGDPPQSEVTAELVHSSRFTLDRPADDRDASITRPMMRGGTPPVKLGGRHVAFMHTVWRRGGRSMYAIAAYAFSAAPPFAIEAVTPPFSLGRHATPYPIGLVASKRHLLLSYGVADRTWYVAKIDRDQLLAALVPVRTDDQTDAVLGQANRSGAQGEPGAMPGAVHHALPRQLHFFRSVPADVRAAMVASLNSGPDRT